MGLQSYDYGLRPHDHFKVLRNFIFTQQHLDILNRLFTPLIGAQATGLYIYLDQFKDTPQETVMTHYVIMNELKTNLSEFRQAMDLLEGIGLVKTFVKHDENQSSFVYQLVQPPTANQYFNDPMLSVYLYSEVSKQRYLQLKAHFEDTEAVDLSQYQETTRKYTDVFSIPRDKDVPDSQLVRRDETYDGVDLTHVQFDFEQLYDLLQSHFISSDIVTKEAKNLIIQLATLYGLTPEDMKRIILKSITSAQELSFEDLRKHARSYYLMEHEQHLPRLQAKHDQQPSQGIEAKAEGTDEQDDENMSMQQYMKLLDETSPIDMLVSWSDSEPTVSQKALVEELVEQQKLSFGVINVLLQYVMLKNDYRLPKDYIREIASNWKKLEFKTASEAYEHIMKQKENSQKRKANKTSYTQRPKKIVSREMTPKWLQERHQSDNNKEQQGTQMSEEETAQFEKEKAALAKRLRQRRKED